MADEYILKITEDFKEQISKSETYNAYFHSIEIRKDNI